MRGRNGFVVSCCEMGRGNRKVEVEEVRRETAGKVVGSELES